MKSNFLTEFRLEKRCAGGLMEVSRCPLNRALTGLFDVKNHKNGGFEIRLGALEINFYPKSTKKRRMPENEKNDRAHKDA